MLVVVSGGGVPAGAQTAPVMTSTPPPPGIVGNPYLHQFTAGPLELLFAVNGGTLPPGLLLTAQGFLTGVPTTPASPLGTPLSATATLVGSVVPTGSMTFRLFDDPFCQHQVFTSEKPPTLYGASHLPPSCRREPEPTGGR